MRRMLVIVVTYNGMRWLSRCLGSVTDADVMVIDNASADGSADFVADNYPEARLVRNSSNEGFSKPNNEGFKYAMEKGYDYVYLLNQDAWLEDGTLDKLIAAADANPDYAILSPMQYQDGYEALDHQFSAAAGTLFQNRRFATPPTSWPPPSYAVEGGTGSERVCLPLLRIMAAHWLVRVSALREIGLFNEELFPFWGQDDDWCNRARFHGYKIGVVPEARAVHDRAQRDEPLERTVQRNYFTGSLVRLADINRPLWDALCYVFAFTFVKVFKYRSFLPLKYLRSIFSRLKEVREHRASLRMRA